MRLRELFEKERRTAVMAFGRMNPPTIGHAKLVDAIKAQPGDHYIFLSQSQKPKTDPLPFQDKLRYAKFFFPNVTIGNPEVKTIIQALQKIETMGYTDLIYVAGSDRVESFNELINKYNGKDYTFKNIKVISAGERDPDADGAEGMSASKMRQAAADNDFDSFKQGVPQQELAGEMFKAVRQGMALESIRENKYSDLGHKKPKNLDVDLKLPNGDKKVLRADDKDHIRGLVVRSNADGSYDSYYWYNDPTRKVPIEITIDGKSVAKDAKNIHWKFHPELNERELSKSELKSRDKTADKIMDKPKAKKSIASWAKDKGMDPEGAVYAIATNMAKKK